MSRRQDDDLQERILERLNEDPTIDAEFIEVSTEDGNVSLHGHVESRDDRKWVEALVRQVPDVEEVMNYLTLQPHGRSDDYNRDQYSQN